MTGSVALVLKRRLCINRVKAIAPPTPFEPARAERVVRVHADDYTSLVVLTPLIAALSRGAPGIQLEVVPAQSGALERPDASTRSV